MAKKKTIAPKSAKCPHCGSSKVKIIDGDKAVAQLGTAYTGKAANFVNEPFAVIKCGSCSSETVIP